MKEATEADKRRYSALTKVALLTGAAELLERSLPQDERSIDTAQYLRDKANVVIAEYGSDPREVVR